MVNMDETMKIMLEINVKREKKMYDYVKMNFFLPICYSIILKIRAPVHNIIISYLDYMLLIMYMNKVEFLNKFNN